MSSFKSSENMQKKEARVDQTDLFRIINPLQWFSFLHHENADEKK